MGMAAILGMWPRRRQQTSVSATHLGLMLNLALIGLMVSEEKTFEDFSQYESM